MLKLQDLLNALTASPWLAVIGLIVVLAIVFAPALLSLAGLTGAQIVELLKATMQFIIEAIQAFRDSNHKPPE